MADAKKKEEGSKTPAKKAAKAPPKMGAAKDAEEEEQQSEGEGDGIPSDGPEESEDSLSGGSEKSYESYDSDLGLKDFVVADDDVEAEELEYEEPEDNADQPLGGIEMQSNEEPQNEGFNIVRVVQHTNKGGADADCPINMAAEYFPVQSARSE